MQATLPLRQSVRDSGATRREPTVADATLARAEIQSYLASRDLLLREAEKNPSENNLRCANAANDFAVDCLRPARSPYEAQALTEAEATRERERCCAVSIRLAELRAFSSRRAA